MEMEASREFLGKLLRLKVNQLVTNLSFKQIIEILSFTKHLIVTVGNYSIQWENQINTDYKVR